MLFHFFCVAIGSSADHVDGKKKNTPGDAAYDVNVDAGAEGMTCHFEKVRMFGSWFCFRTLKTKNKAKTKQKELWNNFWKHEIALKKLILWEAGGFYSKKDSELSRDWK